MRARSEIIKELNDQLDQQVDYDLFKEYDNLDYNDSYQAYLLGVVYQTYIDLFLIDSGQQLGKEVEAIKRVFVKRVFGSSDLRQLNNLYTYLMTNQINPVYYLSAIFNHQAYLSKQHNHLFEVPKVKDLIAMHSYYETQVRYDENNFPSLGGISHRSIEFRTNIVISNFNFYYMMLLNNVPLNRTYSDTKLVNKGLGIYERMVDYDYFPNYDGLRQTLIKGAVSEFRSSRDNLSDKELTSLIRLLRARLEGLKDSYGLGVLADTDFLSKYYNKFGSLEVIKSRTKDTPTSYTLLVNQLFQLYFGVLSKDYENFVWSIDFDQPKWYIIYGLKELVKVSHSFNQFVKDKEGC